MTEPSPSSRRDFLTGKSALQRVRDGMELPDAPSAPSAGHTVRLTQRSMACDFSVILNAGVPKGRVTDASSALDLVADLEQQLSAYRNDSELTLLNSRAAKQPVRVEPRLYALLKMCQRISEDTDTAFDATSGPLVALWRACRDEGRIPTQAELDRCLEVVGMHHVSFDDGRQTVHFDRSSVEINLGGIGKGYALDRAGGQLEQRGIDQWLLHGGHSSLLARGDHHGLGGWPVGIGNPLFQGKRLGTILLRDCAMATSGSNIQFFRHQGHKYGHILNPRTGWPVETMLSVTVCAGTAAEADALSTAFYVMGVEKTAHYCDNRQGVSAILIPSPVSGRQLSPVVLGMPDDRLFLDAEQVVG